MNLDSVPSWLRPTKAKIATSLLALSGLMGFASVAISAEEAAQAMSTANVAATGDEISNGSVIDLGDGLSIAPIAGWKIERKSLGMSLVMKEVLPAQTGEIDYSKPIFARNLTVMTLPEARPIDEAAVPEMKEMISKMFARDPSLKDVTFTDHKFFDYKGKNDGLILFSQLTANNFQMMQMQVIVSGEKKSYLMTYSDLASNFSNPASYDAAWKSMTSIQVPGVAPKRFEKEMMIGGAFGVALLAIIAPFLFIRWYNSRRIRKFADELQYDWDTGAVKSDNDYELSDIGALDQTRPVQKRAKGKKAETTGLDLDLSSISNISAISTRHSRFA
jgi:hypothetical protein